MDWKLPRPEPDHPRPQPGAARRSIEPRPAAPPHLPTRAISPLRPNDSHPGWDRRDSDARCGAGLIPQDQRALAL
ncbi:MAG: hypothetical protein ACK5YZ_01745 [bacterium]